MDTLTVYRVRHKDIEAGPWHAARLLEIDGYHPVKTAYHRVDDYFFKNPMYADSHPNVFFDVFCIWTADLVCGTLSLDGLRDWFSQSDDILNALLDGNFTVYQYTVPEFKMYEGQSGKQVAFNPANAIEVKDLTILALL